MSDNATAISATRRQIRELADGTIEVRLHVDPRFKADFHRLFSDIDMPVALVPLNADFEQKQPEPEQKGGPLSKSAAIQCQYEPFQVFAIEQLRLMKCVWPVEMSKENVARELIIRFCGIQSRAALDHSEKAKSAYKLLMKEFREWSLGN